MFKKIAAFQKIFLYSMPSMNFRQDPKIALAFIVLVIATFMTNKYFSGAPIPFVVGSILMVNKILNGKQRLFDIVPVSRRFTVGNVYLASVLFVVILSIGYLLFFLLSAGIMVGLVLGISYLSNPQDFGQVPADFIAPEQIAINTFQGDLFMLLILIMVLVVGITIAFIKNSKVRNYAYAVFFMLGFGLLFVLRSIMPNIGREFMESISMMPQINELLTAASIATLLIVPMSIYLGYKLYLSPAQKSCE